MSSAKRIVALLVALAMACATTASLAAAPQVKTQAPGFYRMMVGDIEITALSDGTNMLPVGSLLIHVTPTEIHRLLRQSSLKDPVETSFNAFLINTGAKLVLIDTGAGTTMGAHTGHLLDNLRAAGYQPEQVDEVYLTHMHGDHVGALLNGDQRSFPNAVVRADTREAKYWLNAEAMATAPKESKAFFEQAMSRIKPYMDAGKFSPFDGDTALVPGIRSIATYGHTPGHTSYVIESKGERLVVLGDLVHVGAVQFAKPAAALKFDSDSTRAIALRGKVFADAAAHGDWVAAAHLSFPGIGHLRAVGAGYVWVPVNYGTQF